MSSSDLIKHSATIQLAGDLTLNERKSYNVMLRNALPWMQRGEDHWLQTRDLERRLGLKSNNRDYVIDVVEGLRDRSVRYNVFGKDRENAEIWRMHGGLLAEVGANRSRRLIQYSFPNSLIDLLSQPSMYARIDLDIQATFRGSYAIPLWEYYLDVLGGRRNQCELNFSVEQLRALLCLEDSHLEFKRLNDKVIKPAHQEINRRSNIEVTVVEHVRENRRVVGLALHVQRKPHAPAPSEAEPEADPDLWKTLERYFDRPTTSRILARYGHDYIKAQLEYTERARAQRKIGNPSGYLRAALQADYASHREKQARAVAKTKSADADARERKRKELQERQQQAREQAVTERYADLSAEEQERLARAFEESDAYAQNAQLIRKKGRDSGIYQRIFRTWLAHELCPEPEYHDLDAFAASETTGQGGAG